MNVTFNKTDYKILEILIGNNCNTPFRSFTIKYLVNKSGYSHIKIRQSIKTFQMLGYIKEGSKDGNSNTYYVTNEGINHYMQVMDYDEKDMKDLYDFYEEKNNKEKGNE